MTEETAPTPDIPKDSSLPPWKPTFLARLPRKVKIGAVLFLLCLAVLPSYVGNKNAPTKSTLTRLYGKKLNNNTPSTSSTENKDAPTASDQPRDQNELAAIQQNDTDDRGARMSRAPELGMTEDVQGGALPRIGDSGKRPWQVYARPFNVSDRRPRVALVFVDLGLSNPITMSVIDRLHSNVTTAFDAQSPVLASWLARAHQMGHETLLSLPMEPFDYPRSDPGPQTLLTSLPDASNVQRLNNFLKLGSGYIGVTTMTGTRFTSVPDKINPILEELYKRGLVIFDARVAPHRLLKDLARQEKVPSAESSMRIDEVLTPEGIDNALSLLERNARVEGHAIGIASPSPLVVDRVEAWIAGLPSRQIALAPLSALLE